MWPHAHSLPAREWQKLSVVTDMLAFVPVQSARSFRRARAKYHCAAAAGRRRALERQYARQQEQAFEAALSEHTEIMMRRGEDGVPEIVASKKRPTQNRGWEDHVGIKAAAKEAPGECKASGLEQPPEDISAGKQQEKEWKEISSESAVFCDQFARLLTELRRTPSSWAKAISALGKAPIEGRLALECATKALEALTPCEDVHIVGSEDLNALAAIACCEGSRGSDGHIQNFANLRGAKLFTTGTLTELWWEGKSNEFSPLRLLLDFLVDDGVGDRSHRRALLESKHMECGVCATSISGTKVLAFVYTLNSAHQ